MIFGHKITFICPIMLQTKKRDGSTRNWWLSLNQYRNWHYQQSNKLKTLFKATMDAKERERVGKGLKIDVYPVKIVYTLYYPRKVQIDLANYCGVVQKFFDDWLVERNVIEDDSVKYINDIRYVWGGYDKENPRMEVELYSE